MEEEFKPSEQEKQAWLDARLTRIRKGNRQQRRSWAKQLRKSMKKRGVPRHQAVEASKQIVRKNG